MSWWTTRQCVCKAHLGFLVPMFIVDYFLWKKYSVFYFFFSWFLPKEEEEEDLSRQSQVCNKSKCGDTLRRTRNVQQMHLDSLAGSWVLLIHNTDSSQDFSSMYPTSHVLSSMSYKTSLGQEHFFRTKILTKSKVHQPKRLLKIQ